MKTYIMTSQLAEMLGEAVANELWDAGFRDEMLGKIGEIPIGGAIPFPTDAENGRLEEEELAEEYPVASMIDYFGLAAYVS